LEKTAEYEARKAKKVFKIINTVYKYTLKAYEVKQSKFSLLTFNLFFPFYRLENPAIKVNPTARTTTMTRRKVKARRSSFRVELCSSSPEFLMA